MVGDRGQFGPEKTWNFSAARTNRQLIGAQPEKLSGASYVPGHPADLSSGTGTVYMRASPASRSNASLFMYSDDHDAPPASRIEALCTSTTEEVFGHCLRRLSPSPACFRRHPRHRRRLHRILRGERAMSTAGGLGRIRVSPAQAVLESLYPFLCAAGVSGLGLPVLIGTAS
ncbi:hypothetical protein F5Y08DRAFT_338392 [Xylaria arbuscula]|nr:hypothetical protein F5Y08DRAFT_338392 [Xylaria arbuscula]